MKNNEMKPAHEIGHKIAKRIEKRQINLNSSITRGSPFEKRQFGGLSSLNASQELSARSTRLVSSGK